MANVKICDRCGAGVAKHCLMTVKPVRYILGIETTKRMYLSGDVIKSVEYDLCTACAAELDEFLKAKVKDNISEATDA